MQYTTLRKMILPHARATLATSLMMLMTAGCITSKISSPEQTAVEQMLLSTAASRALTSLDYSMFRDQKTFVDAQYLDSYRKEYVLGVLRDVLMVAGAHLVEDRENARLIVEPRSAALSLDERSALLGIPSMPVPLTGGLVLPELALFKKTKQMALGSITVHGYDPDNEVPPFTLGPAIGRAYYSRWWFLFTISFRSTDVEEL